MYVCLYGTIRVPYLEKLFEPQFSRKTPCVASERQCTVESVVTLMKFHSNDNLHINSKQISYWPNQILFLNGIMCINYIQAPKPDLF